jgi:RNase P subunit RPR2
VNPTYTHRATVCPGCRQTINATSDPKGRGAPRSGDVTICVGCGTILRFDAQLRLSAMTPEQLEQLPANTAEELREQQERWRARRGSRSTVVVQ